MGHPNPVAVLDKAVAILRAVADEPATLAELVSRTGLPRATAHRLAVALEGHRLVRRTTDTDAARAEAGERLRAGDLVDEVEVDGEDGRCTGVL